MKKVKELLRLKHEFNFSNRRIAKSLGISRSTISEYLDRFNEAGLCWEDHHHLSAEEIFNRMIPKGEIKIYSKRPIPDWEGVYQELKRKGVTLHLLWKEYREDYSDGYSYSQFCDLYSRWKKRLTVSMRQNHKAGEKLFVDYAGEKVDIKDSLTGEVQKVNIFVAVLGASNYTYAEAHSHQDVKNWISGHVRAFNYFGGVPEILVPDNLKAGVKSPCYYEPVINPTYHEMAKYYNIAVIPARVKKAKDKAKVEVGVQIVQRSILARLRHREFFSINQLNHEIKAGLEALNNREMRHIGKSRKQLFESVDKPFLRPLPENNFEYAEWKQSRVGIDYHVKFDHNFYSVPYKYMHESMDVRATVRMVEIFYKDQLIALHKRSYGKNKSITEREHMPHKHRNMQEWNPERFLRWSRKIGKNTVLLIEKVLISRNHPEQSYRKCLGILGLERRYGRERLESACKRALHFDILSYRRIKRILDNGLDRINPESDKKEEIPLIHENIRGDKYYKEDIEKC